jgi:hypothetical protein
MEVHLERQRGPDEGLLMMWSVEPGLVEHESGRSESAPGLLVVRCQHIEIPIWAPARGIELRYLGAFHQDQRAIAVLPHPLQERCGERAEDRRRTLLLLKRLRHGATQTSKANGRDRAEPVLMDPLDTRAEDKIVDCPPDLSVRVFGPMEPIGYERRRHRLRR